VTGLGNVGAFIGASRISEDSRHSEEGVATVTSLAPGPWWCSCLPSRNRGNRVGVTNSFIGSQLVSNFRSTANRMLTRRSGEAATVTDVVAQLLLSREGISASISELVSSNEKSKVLLYPHLDDRRTAGFLRYTVVLRYKTILGDGGARGKIDPGRWRRLRKNRSLGGGGDLRNSVILGGGGERDDDDLAKEPAVPGLFYAFMKTLKETLTYFSMVSVVIGSAWQARGSRRRNSSFVKALFFLLCLQVARSTYVQKPPSGLPPGSTLQN